MLGATEYAKGSEALQADIIVSLADVPYGRALVPKRVDKMLDRSTSWLREHVALRSENVDRPSKASLFASLLPLSCTAQQSYLDYIMEEAVDAVSGLALHNVAPLDDLPRQLRPLPRLGLLSPGTPHEVLRQILQGLDISTLPFITTATDAGIAFSFEFPAPAYEGEERTSRDALALGIDMWSSDHAADLSPLVPECDCYACTNHHKAYVQHLLVAKEMLGWVLLQIHNHHIIDKFFGSIRQGIADGKLEQQTGQFAEYYESHLPEGSGQGPRYVIQLSVGLGAQLTTSRLRGYQFSSQGPGEPKRNKAPYTTLNNDKADTSGAQGITVEAVAIDADGLEQQGFAAKEV